MIGFRFRISVVYWWGFRFSFSLYVSSVRRSDTIFFFGLIGCVPFLPTDENPGGDEKSGGQWPRRILAWCDREMKISQASSELKNANPIKEKKTILLINLRGIIHLLLVLLSYVCITITKIADPNLPYKYKNPDVGSTEQELINISSIKYKLIFKK